jgi:Flp pilus assembly protein TadB
MGPVDAFWHLSNLFGPALGMALLAPSLAKLLWRQELRGVRWRGLALWTLGACALVVLAGLLLTGRDGRMATYAALVFAAALVLWWRGWLAR